MGRQTGVDRRRIDDQFVLLLDGSFIERKLIVMSFDRLSEADLRGKLKGKGIWIHGFPWDRLKTYYPSSDEPAPLWSTA
ncbi:hypothetical protein BWP39_23425 [Paraburkholderia acidicola]|uniref:Uncharacterized protein n=1 Tax=Paraburkholderia acidicola TaxID=1912599 RepID=A0A2A4EQR9_9BURK|nr:hypothetical protein BWP39_23425 [Paraburkholderia acidicola]